MAMDQEQKESLVRGMGGEIVEPDKVTPPEKVSESGKVIPPTEKAVNEDEWQRPNDEEIKGMQGWIKQVAEDYMIDDSEGNKILDIKKLAKEQGYNVATLVKEGQIVANPEEVAATAATEKKILESFSPEQQEYLTKREESMQAKIDAAITPLHKESAQARHNVWISNVKEKYEDFKDLSKDIGSFVQRTKMKINSQADLEQAYFAVKGAKSVQAQESNSPAGGGLTKGGTTNPSGEASKSEGDKIFDEILNAGAVKHEKETQALFGRTHLRPITGK